MILHTIISAEVITLLADSGGFTTSERNSSLVEVPLRCKMTEAQGGIFRLALDCIFNVIVARFRGETDASAFD